MVYKIFHLFVRWFFLRHSEQTSVYFTKTLIDFVDGWRSILLLFLCDGGGGAAAAAALATLFTISRRKHQQCQPNVNEMKSIGNFFGCI